MEVKGFKVSRYVMREKGSERAWEALGDDREERGSERHTGTG